MTNLQRHSYQVAPRRAGASTLGLCRDPLPSGRWPSGARLSSSGVLSAAREPKGRLRERSQARSVSDAQLLGVRRSSRLTHKLESRQRGGRIEVMQCRLVRGLGGLDPLVRLLDCVLVCSAAVCGQVDMRGTRFAARVAYACACTPHLLGMKRLGISRRSEKGRNLLRASRPVLESPKKITSTVGS